MATFVSTDWVEERLEAAGFLVLDARSAMRYLQGHLKSAVSLPLRKMLDQQARLLPVDQLSRVFGSVGLGGRETPVLYDGHDGRNAAMLAWALEYLGRDDVHIMEVVFDRWKDQGREIFYRPVQPAARDFTARVDAGARACLADISGAPDLKLVDTRSREEFAGEIDAGETDADERPGHVPGAVNVVWQELVGEDGHLLCSGEKARQVLAAAGINRNDRIVAYCQVGVRAAVAYLAFKRLGYDVRLYDASYAEWERSGLPVEKGEPSFTKEGSPGSG